MPEVGEVLSLLKKVRKNQDGWTACCPAHEDRNPSMSINIGKDGKLLLYCFAGCSYKDICSALGINDEAPPLYKPRRKQRITTPEAVRPARSDLKGLMQVYRASLKNSYGEIYLGVRGIPLDLALEMNVGYAEPGSWRHENSNGEKVRQGKYGRLVFPHTDPEGNVINFYGRAVELGTHEEPKSEKHDNLVGGKGYFNARAIPDGRGPLYVCEGPFDALSLMACGIMRTIAIFGIGGWRDTWCQGIDRIILAFDNDDSGRKATNRFISQTPSYCARSIDALPEEAYGGCKDMNESLVRKGLPYFGHEYIK